MHRNSVVEAMRFVSSKIRNLETRNSMIFVWMGTFTLPTDGADTPLALLECDFVRVSGEDIFNSAMPAPRCPPVGGRKRSFHGQGNRIS